MGLNLSKTVSNYWRILRFLEYGPNFILAGIFGAVLTFNSLDIQMLPLIFFIVTSSGFGFVINDIADRFEDSETPDTRNPVAAGDMSLRSSSFLAVSLFLLTVASLFTLPSNHLVGATIILIFINYSFLLKAKDHLGLDVLFHSLGPALYVTMGYTLYKEADFMCMTITAAAGLLSASAELVQEVRDYNRDIQNRKNTVVTLGKRKTLILTLGMMVLAFLLVGGIGYYVPQLGWVIPALPLTVFLIQPVVQAIKDQALHAKLPNMLNTRGVIIAILTLIILVFLWK
jgi:4-hydroxybenzoate polyprenyltransferase